MQPLFRAVPLLAFVVLMALPTIATAQARRSHPGMERCVDTVLKQLARAGTPETAVGPTVVSHCDAQLRAALAAAIASGEAAGCTVEACIDLARGQAAQEATQAYRLRIGQ